MVGGSGRIPPEVRVLVFSWGALSALGMAG